MTPTAIEALEARLAQLHQDHSEALRRVEMIEHEIDDVMAELSAAIQWED